VDRRVFVVAGLATLAAAVNIEAQQAAKIPRVGFLSTGKWVPPEHPYLRAISDGLRDAGYVVGQNIIVDWQFAENDPDREPELIARLIRTHVDVLLCVSSTEVLAAKNATRTIPIVMLGTSDPVGLGFAQSLAHPGGNITGLSPNHAEVGRKRVQLLRELVQKTSKIGVLNPSDNAGSALQLRALEGTARSLGVELYVVKNVKSPDGLERAFAAFTRERVESVIIIQDPLSWDYRELIGKLALSAHLPAISQDRQIAEAGLLMSYGVDEVRFWRRAASFIDRILKGAKPGDLPIEQPTEFVLAINLRTAKALGLTISPSLLQRADQVIE
jgi:putative tryptophan/tyrosine transport system substrate-binding protein